MELTQIETVNLDRMKLHLWPDVLSQTGAHVSSERWQLRLAITNDAQCLKSYEVFYEEKEMKDVFPVGSTVRIWRA